MSLIFRRRWTLFWSWVSFISTSDFTSNWKGFKSDSWRIFGLNVLTTDLMTCFWIWLFVLFVPSSFALKNLVEVPGSLIFCLFEIFKLPISILYFRFVAGAFYIFLGTLFLVYTWFTADLSLLPPLFFKIGFGSIITISSCSIEEWSWAPSSPWWSILHFMSWMSTLRASLVFWKSNYMSFMLLRTFFRKKSMSLPNFTRARSKSDFFLESFEISDVMISI